MKRKTFLTGAASLCVAFLLITSGAHVCAQTAVAASIADVIMAPVGFPNSATIDYSPFCGGCTVGTTQLTAVVSESFGLGPTPMLYLNDMATPGVWMSAAIPAPMFSFPDVVIGNDPTSASNFIVGVVAAPPCPMGAMNIVLYLYHVIGPPYVLAPAPYAVIPIAMTCNGQPNVHIDIEAQTSNLTLGLPMANKFTITWQDITTGIMAYTASLNGPFPVGATVINPSLTVVGPDVAMVERYNTSTTSYEDWALFTYVDAPGAPISNLYYQEWRISPPSIPGPVAVRGMNNYIGAPRIDAIDDYNFNGSPLFAPYDIATNVGLPSPPGGASIIEYNNFTGVAGADITSLVTGGVGISGGTGGFNTIPTVTCGPGHIYSVGYFDMFPNSSYYTTAVDWTTGVPSTNPNAYAINFNPMMTFPLYWGGLALSATCNTNAVGTQWLFAAYGDMTNLYDKYDLLAPPYSFKHSQNNTASVVATDSWQLSPNPASDHVVLTAPPSYTVSNGITYRITDVNGKVLQQSNMSSNVEQINVNNLTTGMYQLNVYNNNAKEKTLQFVKE